MYSVVFNDFVTQSVQNCLLCSLLDETGKFIRLLSNFCTFQNMKGVNGESIFCPPIQKAYTFLDLLKISRHLPASIIVLSKQKNSIVKKKENVQLSA